MLSPLPTSVASTPSIDISPESRRREIESSVSDLLSDLMVTIISDYDTRPALKPLKTAADGEVEDSEQNQEIRAAIRDAFMSMRTDRRMIRIMIENAIKGNYVSELNHIFDEIRNQGQTIYLNYADLSNMTITGLNLSMACAQQVDFTGTTLVDVRFNGATLLGSDLSSAVLRSSNLSFTDMQHVTMLNTDFFDTLIDGRSLDDNDGEIRDIVKEVEVPNRFGDLVTRYYLNGRHSFQPAPVPVGLLYT